MARLFTTAPFCQIELTTFAIAVLLSLCTVPVSSASVDKSKASKLAELPPIVFPEDNTKYNIIPNNLTIIRSLSHNTTSTEIEDLNHVSQSELESEKYKITNTNEKDESLLVIPIEVNSTPNKSALRDPKSDSEFIFSPSTVVKKDTMDTLNKAKVEGMTGKWAIISLSTILIIFFVMYFGTVLWKKYIVSKYDSRQILVNEEDLPSNFKHSEF